MGLRHPVGNIYTYTDVQKCTETKERLLIQSKMTSKSGDRLFQILEFLIWGGYD